MRIFAKGRLIYKILFALFSVVYCIVQVGSVIAMENATVINSQFHIKDYELVETGDATDTDYFESDYYSLEELSADGQVLAEQVEAEGAVLLKNENNALPLNSGDNISLFSYSTVDPAFGGSGSASSDNPKPAVTMKDGFTAAGLNINTTLWNFYSSNKKYASSKYMIKDASWSDITGSIGSSSFATYGDAAIFNIKRCRGENSDPSLSSSSCDGENGNYLALNANEKSVLSGMASLKGATFKKIIVLLNTPNQVEAKFIDNPEYKIDAVLWIGAVGQTGMSAVGKILVGDIAPSGRLSDTFWYDHRDNPAMANFGNMRYANYADYKGNLPNEADNSYTVMSYSSYVAYQEGIYVGYRYTETRYEDVVTGRSNAGNFDYSSVVAYPFGFGLSYTEFEYSDYGVSYGKADDIYTVTAKITNIGSVSAREVFQVYVQKPYTDYDIANGIEKSAVELAGFTKTKLLAAGESETVTVTVKGSQLASYDAENAKTYILDSGDYYFATGKNAHDAENNILAAKGYNTINGMTASGNSGLVKKFNLSFDSTKYSVSETGEKITNLFEQADWNKYENNGGTTLTYVSRNDWASTLPDNVNDRAVLYMNADMVSQLLSLTNSDSILPDDVEYPAYEQGNKLSLVDLRVDSEGNEIPYDSEIWDKLLDNLSWSETCLLITEGMRSTASASTVGKPATVEHNGPNGVTEKYSFGDRGLATIFGDPDADYSPTYYPCINILASTFDKELAENVGKMYGEDALWAGYSGLYGIGVNLHRTAYDGRSFEYYSEDGFLSGAMSTKVVIGLQSKGCNAYLKHLAVYEQQANRVGLSVWVNEQTLRELYLKPFEMAIKDGNARNLMTSYTRFGVMYCPALESLLKNFVRGECGLQGLIVTDMYANRYSNDQLPMFLMAGCDLPDGNLNSYSIYDDYKDGYGELAWRMRDAAKRILYATSKTNALNGISSTTIIRKITPEWQKALKGGVIASGILFGLSFACYMVCEIYLKVKKPESEETEKA